MTLETMYLICARRLYAMGVPCDDTPAGPVAGWIRRKVAYRPDTLFYIVLGVNCALADLYAQAEGFEGSIDRACKIAFRKAGPCK